MPLLGRKRDKKKCLMFILNSTPISFCFLNGVIHSALFSFTTGEGEGKNTTSAKTTWQKINFTEFLFSFIKKEVIEKCFQFSQLADGRAGKLSMNYRTFNLLADFIQENFGFPHPGTNTWLELEWCQMTQHKIKYCAIIHQWYSKIHRISYFNAGINLWYSWSVVVLCVLCLPLPLNSILWYSAFRFHATNICINVNNEFIHSLAGLTNKYLRNASSALVKTAEKPLCWLNSSSYWFSSQRVIDCVRYRRDEKKLLAMIWFSSQYCHKE